jgi:chemotaxis protein CheX
MTGPTLPSTEDLETIAEQVWSAYLAEDAHRPAPTTEPGDHTQLTASVAMAGAWAGHLIVTSTYGASRAVASSFLAMPMEEVTTDDVGDALGELANVLGGNVKSLLPSPSVLSLPRVAGTEHERWPGTSEVCRAVVHWRGHPFLVALLRGSSIASLMEKVPA